MDKLDSNLLRTFRAIVETGSITAGAAMIYRSQSAASLQIQQLEELVGQRVFERHGRGIVLTEAGERLVPVAQRISRMLDETLADMKSDTLTGKLRVGLEEDHCRKTLSRIVADFAREHPRVELEVQCAISTGFPKALGTGGLDLAVYEAAGLEQGMELLREESMTWAASKAHGAQFREPLPVAVFDRACWWRDVALETLEGSGRSYRIVYSSESVSGVVAAVEAGIAVGFLSGSCLHEGLVKLPLFQGAHRTPTSKLVLHYGRTSKDPITIAMAIAVKKAFLSLAGTSNL